jgi:F0F1-type ATP synthase membrane subunit a
MELISKSLIRVLKEFGVVGVLTYVAGLISLGNLFFGKTDFETKILFGIIGLVLFILAWILIYFRMKIQKDREQALIEMVTKTNEKLADKVGGNCTNEQIVSITQSIWQTQEDLIETISDIEFRDKK